MTDRCQPGAQGSRLRNIEIGETTGQLSGGFVVDPTSPTLSSRRYADLDETAYDGFSITHDNTTSVVTIGPGEAYVDGWVARDVDTDVNLLDNTPGQRIVLGWDPDSVYDDEIDATRDAADDAFIDTEQNILSRADPEPYMVLYELDTDTNGVVADSVSQKFEVGPTMEAVNTQYDSDASGAVDTIADGAVDSGALGDGAVGADQIDNESINTITLQQADEVVEVGPNSEYDTINAAIGDLTKERPVYDASRYKAIVLLDNDYVMEEQVLVDGMDLSWIWIQTKRGTDVGTVEDFVQGTQISGYDRPEITNISIDDYPVESEFQEDNSRFLDGEYIVMDGGDSGTGDAYYFWFNVTDATDLAHVDSNAGDPNLDPANFSGVSSFTSVQVDILLEDSASQVTGKLQTEVDAVAEFGATASSNTLTITNADDGTVDIIPSASVDEYDLVRTTVASDGSESDTLGVSPFENQDWIIDGRTATSGTEVEPTLNLVRGYTYTFNLDATTGHPLRFQTVEAPYDSTQEYNDGVSVSGDRETGTITFSVPNDAPDELYYVSENSPDMEGRISITDDGESGYAPVTTAQVVDATLSTYDSSGTVNEVFVDDATVLNGNYVEAETHDGTNPVDVYFWFNVNGEGTDPGVSGTGYEVTLAQGATPSTATNELQTVANGLTNASASVSTTRTVQITNANSGSVDDAVATGSYVETSVIQDGRGAGYYVQVNLTGHGLSNGDRIRISGHMSGFEEFNYNGTWFVTNAATNTFELDYVSDNDAVYDADRASNPTTADVDLPEPVPVTRAALDTTWEFFYQPAFGVARGTLPTIDCLFDMDTSGSNPYLSYKDGLCATDGGIINITPFNGFINAGGSNIYATRRSAINANDAIANGAGRMGVWAYSNSLINARRVEAKNCGLAGSGSDTGNGFDSAGRPVGNGVNATRGSLVNAAGVTTGGCQGDNIYASYGGQINLEGHTATPTFDTASVNGQDINIDGGTVTESDGTRFDQIKDTDGNAMLQGVVASGQATLSGGLAEFSTNINDTDATFMLALGIDDPNADAEVAGSLFWDDDAGNYEIRIRETETSVGNPTVNYDVLRVR